LLDLTSETIQKRVQTHPLRSLARTLLLVGFALLLALLANPIGAASQTTDNLDSWDRTASEAEAQLLREPRLLKGKPKLRMW